jgi:voltage-gated sodium channel type IV alpha
MQLFVIGNILNLASDHYPIDMERLKQSENWNVLFTFAYMSEVIVKIAGLGVKGYFSESRFHLFDVIISLLSVIDVIITNLFLREEDLYNSVFITVCRAVRTIRLFKLARFWRGFRTILQTIWETITTIYPFLCLLGVVLYSYTMIGIELFSFRAKINPLNNNVDKVNGISPKFNFDSFINSFTTVFIILTNDGQSTIYYDYFRTANLVAATFYWLTFVMFAQKILLNVFIAIILQKFNELTVKNTVERIEEKSFNRKTNLHRRLARLIKRLWRKYVKREEVEEEESVD